MTQREWRQQEEKECI